MKREHEIGEIVEITSSKLIHGHPSFFLAKVVKYIDGGRYLVENLNMYRFDVSDKVVYRHDPIKIDN